MANIFFLSVFFQENLEFVEIRALKLEAFVKVQKMSFEIKGV
jgi:hypothetical protein